MWNDDEAIQRTLSIMDPQTKYYYQKVAQKLHDNIDYETSTVVDESREFDSASQIDLMLRDGMCVSLLSDAEKAVYVNVYGLSRLENYNK